LDNNYTQKDIKLAVEKALEIAKIQKCSFVKIDFDENFQQGLQLILDNYKIIQNTKPLQYKSTMTLDLEIILEILPDDNFFENSKIFWKTTNNNVQRYTKKANLANNWTVSTQKTLTNFEHFWQVYKATSNRQDFKTHTKDYYQKLYELDFSKIIILFSHNIPQAVWFGIATENTLTYLYGGNTDFALANLGQYKIQLEAVKLAVANNLRFYDLGGYEAGKGYARFKENYKGDIRVFSDPLDIIVNLFWYNFVNFSVKIIKLFKR
jgi:lipid II:glycine glycyltransferase (peptidoglycan interpeptide bridge formation enzyme)